MPRLLVISRGPSLPNIVSLWGAPWLTSDERSTAKFYGHYADTGEEGSVTIAVDGLTHLYEKNRTNVLIGGLLMALDDAQVDERKISFHYQTETHTAHILV